eukprot:3521689-Amphidinium_carterae.1
MGSDSLEKLNAAQSGVIANSARVALSARAALDLKALAAMSPTAPTASNRDARCFGLSLARAWIYASDTVRKGQHFHA